MNFSQLHERLRLEVLRRIDREVLTAALLARQTGLQQSHISNFLRSKRRLSLPALDRVLAAQSLSVEDLSTAAESTSVSTPPLQDAIPLISQASAMNDPTVPLASATELIRLPAITLSGIRPRQSARGRKWQRFVAIGVTPAQAESMHPVLLPNMILVLDRHHTSLSPHQPGVMDIFAVKVEKSMMLRYVTFDANRLVLRPHRLESPIRLVEVEPQISPSDLIIGRVCAYIGQR